METVVHANMTDDTTARLRRLRSNSYHVLRLILYIHIYPILLTNQKKKY